jgi:tripartite-type tricarboxylate transporter receptor subunit TctC
MVKWIVAAAAVACALVAPAGIAQAQSVEEFYKANNRITIITMAPPGGGYDLNARTLARYMTKYIPGHPGIVISSMPGANGMLAANHIYNVAAKDGTVIGAGSRTMPYAPLFDIKAARYDVTKMHWLGSTASDTGLTIAWHTAPVKTAADLFTKELIIGATQPSADTYFFPYVFNALLGTKYKIVGGYKAQPPILLAMERGEVQGDGNVGYESLVATHPEWISEHKINFIWQVGTNKRAELPNVPLVSEFAKTDEQRRLLPIFLGMKQYGYPFYTAAEVPGDRVKALRTAFSKAVADPEFIEESKKQARESTPSSGEEMQETLGRSYALSPQVLAKVRSLIPK